MNKKYLVKASIYTKRGVLIAEAFNSYTKTHPLQNKYAIKTNQPYKQTLHAELACIIRAKGKGYRIVVERYNKKGDPANAKPCIICEMAIKEAGIQVVEYTVG